MDFYFSFHLCFSFLSGGFLSCFGRSFQGTEGVEEELFIQDGEVFSHGVIKELGALLHEDSGIGGAVFNDGLFELVGHEVGGAGGVQQVIEQVKELFPG